MSVWRIKEPYYCSELIVDAFKYANSNLEFFPEEPMSFRDETTAEILEYWKKYYALLGRPVPVGEMGSNPGKFSLSNKINILHRYGFLRNWH